MKKKENEEIWFRELLIERREREERRGKRREKREERRKRDRRENKKCETKGWKSCQIHREQLQEQRNLAHYGSVTEAQVGSLELTRLRERGNSVKQFVARWGGGRRIGELAALPRFLRSSRLSGVEHLPAQLVCSLVWTYTCDFVNP